MVNDGAPKINIRFDYSTGEGGTYLCIIVTGRWEDVFFRFEICERMARAVYVLGRWTFLGWV